MIELEKKILLSEEEYFCLLDYFCKDSEPIIQTNYYFDNDVLSLNLQNITCRIRFKDGKYSGTIKRHVPSSDNSFEKEISVRNGIWDNDFIDMGLQLQGELVTERTVAIQNDIIEMVLDKNEYLGCVDYELEIEYKYEREDIAMNILENVWEILNSLKYKHISGLKSRILNAKSKSKRFFEKLNYNER